VVCRSLANGGRAFSPQLVVGPTTGGVVIAYEVARQLGIRGVIAECDPEGGRSIGRHFRIEPGERTLVVDDVLTTGGSVREALEAVRKAGGEPVGVAVMVDRSAGSVDFGVPLYAATEVEMETWEPADCPLCRAGVALEIT
jgi:orotate phosphoribosyltransferase